MAALTKCSPILEALGKTTESDSGLFLLPAKVRYELCESINKTLQSYKTQVQKSQGKGIAGGVTGGRQT